MREEVEFRFEWFQRWIIDDDDDDCGWLAGYNDDRMDWRFAVVECGDFLLIIFEFRIDVDWFRFCFRGWRSKFSWLIDFVVGWIFFWNKEYYRIKNKTTTNKQTTQTVFFSRIPILCCCCCWILYKLERLRGEILDSLLNFFSSFVSCCWCWSIQFVVFALPREREKISVFWCGERFFCFVRFTSRI